MKECNCINPGNCMLCVQLKREQQHGEFIAHLIEPTSEMVPVPGVVFVNTYAPGECEWYAYPTREEAVASRSDGGKTTSYVLLRDPRKIIQVDRAYLDGLVEELRDIRAYERKRDEIVMEIGAMRMVLVRAREACSLMLGNPNVALLAAAVRAYDEEEAERKAGRQDDRYAWKCITMANRVLISPYDLTVWWEGSNAAPPECELFAKVAPDWVPATPDTFAGCTDVTLGDPPKTYEQGIAEGRELGAKEADDMAEYYGNHKGISGVCLAVAWNIRNAAEIDAHPDMRARMGMRSGPSDPGKPNEPRTPNFAVWLTQELEVSFARYLAAYDRSMFFTRLEAGRTTVASRLRADTAKLTASNQVHEDRHKDDPRCAELERSGWDDSLVWEEWGSSSKLGVIETVAGIRARYESQGTEAKDADAGSNTSNFFNGAVTAIDDVLAAVSHGDAVIADRLIVERQKYADQTKSHFDQSMKLLAANATIESLRAELANLKGADPDPDPKPDPFAGKYWRPSPNEPDGPVCTDSQDRESDSQRRECAQYHKDDLRFRWRPESDSQEREKADAEKEPSDD